jgi:BspA type Leucine rich repeat region (6 copies)
MKKITFSLAIVLFSTAVRAAVVKTVNSSSAGMLTTYFTPSERGTVTDLTVTGKMDARDFKFIRDTLKALVTLDLNGASILAYNGNKGTDLNTTSYAENSFPTSALCGDETHPNQKLEKVILPTNIQKIGGAAFSYCVVLRQVDLPSGLLSIGYNAFYGTALESLTIPNTVTEVQWNAFSQCASLTTVKLSSSLTNISMWSFSYCFSLQEIEIPESVTYIENRAFFSCINLKKVTLPVNLTDLGSDVFNECTALNTVIVKNPVPIDLYATNNSLAFGQVSNQCTLWVPQGTSSIYSSTLIWNFFQTIKEVTPTSVNENSVQPSAVYYNTLTDEIIMNGTAQNAAQNYQIMGMNGMVVLQGATTADSRINTAGLGSGAYLLVLDNGSKIKFIKY